MAVATPSLPTGAPPRQRSLAGYVLRLGLFFLFVSTLGFFFIAGYLAQYLSTTVRSIAGTTPAAHGLPYESVEFPAQVDGIPIRGWWVPAPGADRTVVFVHGKDSNRAGGPALDIAKLLHRAGYNSLLIDLRGCGESRGDRFSLGYFEVRDVSGAIDFLEAEYPEAARHVALIGFSMGAATAVLAGGADRRVGAVIEDSGYAGVTDLLEREIPRQSRLPGLITWPTVWMGRLLQGYDISTVRPAAAMPSLADRGLLIIHGARDTVVPLVHAELLIAAAEASRVGSDAPFEVWVVPDADHVGAYRRDPAGYERRVLDLLDQTFGEASAGHRAA
ncbi:MAG TPA: alpha/beta fold hydrolase [Dehalococcoidia bacterium]|nr:alpha/beta fold hydrolase [Dehalococcoidia bacterium]